MSKKTEAQIIEYWKQNRVEMRAFAAVPVECQEWLQAQKNVDRLCNNGTWLNAYKLSAHVQGEIFTLCADYQPAPAPKKGRWVEYDVDKKGYIYINGLEAYLYDISKLTSRSGGIFGGWLWKHGEESFWSAQLHGVDGANDCNMYAGTWQYPLIPTKIRFWVVK